MINTRTIFGRLMPRGINMQLLRELLQLDEKAEAKKKKKVNRNAAASVYHRDYVKTKNKPYRKYDPSEHKKED